MTDTPPVACLLSHALLGASATFDQIFEGSVGAVHGLRQVEFTVLQVLARNPGVHQKWLCEAIGISASRMTQMLNRLLVRGLIKPSPALHDRRCRCIELTPQGHALALETHRSLLQDEARLLPLTCGEREFLCELLDRLVHRKSAPPRQPSPGSAASTFHAPEPSPLHP